MKELHKIGIVFICLLFLSPSIIASESFIDHSFNQSKADRIQQSCSDVSTSPLGGSRYNIQGWVYVNIKGDAYERGYQYGYLAGEEIIDLMNRWSNMILNHPRIKPIRPLLSEQHYDAIAEKWWNFCTKLAEKMYWDEYPEEYRQEMRGIAAGVTEKGLLLFGDPISYKDVLASNEMYEMLSKITDRKVRKSIHPLLSFFSLIQPTVSQYSTVSADEFIEDFYPENEQDTAHHHCSAFIATGDATVNDEVIIANSMWSSIDGAGMWWWSYYIAIRWNIILDVIPTEGNRFQMSCAPGYIWSDHDFYQNEVGIVFIETTLPQGVWTEKGLPLAVRARKAVQYADSIDDVIHFLRTDNDGVMNAVWLIGDTKTGEIARYELGLYHDAVIERTTDGFQWSSNNPIDFWVRWEKMDWKLLFQQVLYSIVLGMNNYQYHTPWYLPAARDIAFEELGNAYYGRIDVDIVKQIMGTDPIGTYSPDCKITCDSLLEHNGLIVHSGNPGGKTLSMAYFDSPEVYYEDLDPIGWVEIYGLPDDHNVQVIRNERDCNGQSIVDWSVALEENSNDFYSYSEVKDDVVYSVTSSGRVVAISTIDEKVLWTKEIGRNPTNLAISDHRLFVGSDEGLSMIDLGWSNLLTKPIGEVSCKPVLSMDSVFVGTRDGGVYCIDKESGMISWIVMVDGVPFLSNIENNVLIVAAGETVSAVNRSDGNLIWSFETEGLLKRSAFQQDEVVFVGCWDTNLYALDQRSGDVLWMFDSGWGIETIPVIIGEKVIFGSHDQNVYALDRANGNVLWVFSCKAGIHSDPVIWQDSVVIGSDDGGLYRLNCGTGSEIWCFAPGNTIQDATRNYVTTPIRSSVAVDSDQLFIGVLGRLYSIH